MTYKHPIILCFLFRTNIFHNTVFKLFSATESGNVCSSKGRVINGNCYMSVKSNHPKACQDIFQSNSHAAYIKSEYEQDAVRSNFLLLGLTNFIFYRIGVAVKNASTLCWEDGTPVRFSRFSENLSIGVLSEVEDYCVFLNFVNYLEWELHHCNSSETETATVCQLGECKQKLFTSKVCEDVYLISLTQRYLMYIQDGSFGKLQENNPDIVCGNCFEFL